MRPRTRFRVYLGLSILWTLMLAQAISHAAAGEGRLSIQGIGLYVTVQTVLAIVCVRAWRSRSAATEQPHGSEPPDR